MRTIMPGQAGFGCKHSVFPSTDQCLSNDSFRFRASIDVGRVNKVNASVHCGMKNAGRSGLICSFAKCIRAQPKCRYPQTVSRLNADTPSLIAPSMSLVVQPIIT